MVTQILGTLSPKLYEIVQEPMETSCHAWLTIEAQFLGNHESCVLQLDTKFHIFKQGDLSVSDYCRRMKGMVDDLRVLGETITDHHLVFNLLQDLNKRFDQMKIFIKQSHPFPSFHTIEEIELDNSVAQGHASVPLGGWRPPQQQLPSWPPQQELSCPLTALPLLPPAPTTTTKVRGKARIMALVALVAPITIVGAPQHGPPSMIPGLAPSRCGQGCALLSSRHLHCSTPCSLHRCTTVPQVALPLQTYRCLHRTTIRYHGSYLVAQDGHMRSTVIDQLLQPYGLDSPDSHRLGHRFRRLQPHQLGCR
jgi:hypothetical protein